MDICVIGTGYVGLVSGAGFAETGNQVICADIDQDKIARLDQGETIIYEQGLDAMIGSNREQGRLSFSSDVEASVRNAEAIFVAVGTPPREDGAADLSAVDQVAETVARAAQRQTALVLKSTVPVGTNARVRRIVRPMAKTAISVVSNPEFLKEGDAVNDFLRPDRIVVGCDEDDAYARDLMRRLYHPLTLSGERIVWMDPASAELTKYVANTMLAMRISFMNEVAGLCERVDADINSVRRGVGADSRIGKSFLYSGAGYGGSCFPKDVQALVHTAQEQGMELELAATTDRVNRRQKGVLLRKLKHHFQGDLRGKKVAVWGIAFKPRTDDIREAASVTLIDGLLAEGVRIAAHDPEASDRARERFGERVEIVQNAYDAVQDADALVLVTEWRAYQNPDFERIKSMLKRPLLVDGRNIWAAYGLQRLGFVYDGIGTRAV